jgi:hypothetical protein
MSHRENAVECVVYSHPWAVDMIKPRHFGNLQDTLIVELASRSQLASLFDLQHRLRHGLAGILADPRRIEDTAEHHDRLPAPCILAPNPPVSESAIVSAVATLPNLECRFDRFLLLVHVNEHYKFVHAMPYCTRFYFLWDLADPPTHPLATVAGNLRQQGVLSRSNWGGFFWFVHPKRRIPEPELRLAQLKQAMRGATRLIGQSGRAA